MLSNFGLAKLAEDIIEQNSPDTEAQEKDTVITCISDCMYCQNPEKTCMLNNVTISQDEQGTFTCGQYAPQQEMVQQPQQMAPQQTSPEQQPTAAKEGDQTKAQIGLSKVKPQAKQAPGQKMGLDKVKQPQQ